MQTVFVGNVFKILTGVLLVELGPLKNFMLKSYPPVPENVTLFGNRVTAMELVKMRLSQLGGP